jgi:hypothetical protein
MSVIQGLVLIIFLCGMFTYICIEKKESTKRLEIIRDILKNLADNGLLNEDSEEGKEAMEKLMKKLK